jgi:hypothetical protein
LLVEHLNEDPEIAFLVPPDGEPPRGGVRWTRGRVLVGDADRLAVKTAFDVQRPQAMSPSPLHGGSRATVTERWWAVRPVASLSDGIHTLWHVPAGKDAPGHSGTIRLDLWTRHLPYSAEERASGGELVSHHPWPDPMLESSAFQWIGSHYAPALKVTNQWWSRLKRWFRRNCVALIPSTGGRSPTFYAFPSALALLKAGINYRANNWPLDASIRAAPSP